MCVVLRILRSSLYGETICLHTYQDTYLLRYMHEIDSLCGRVRGANRDTTSPHSNRYIKNCVSLGYQKPQWSHGGRGCQLCQTATAPHVTCCVVAKSPKVVDSSRLRGGKVRPRLTGTTRDGRKPVWAWLADTGLVVSSPLSAGVPIIPLTHHQVRFRFAGPISTA